MRRLLDSPWFYFCLAGLLVVVAVASQVELQRALPLGTSDDLLLLAEREEPLNVVFILVDTLRADHLSCYGYERETSPNLDQLAAQGVRFARVEAQSSWTKASMASLWLSSHPERTGVSRFSHGVPEDATTPAELFRAAGYRTAGIYRNAWVDENFGFGQGFDVYQKPVPTRRPDVKRESRGPHPLRGTDLDATESAIEFLRHHGHEPFFLYLHYMDVHQYTYDEGSAVFGAGYEDAYDNAIHWTDRNLGLLVNALHERDLLRKTLIVFASDHGEGFVELRGIEGHARSLYREVTETPLVLIPPFEMSPGVVVPQLVSNIDIWPTIFDLLGMAPTEGVEGRSLVPLIRAAAEGAEPEWDDVAYAQLDRSWGRPTDDPLPLISLVDGPYRLVRAESEPRRDELFDRRSDPEERHDIAAARPEIVADLGARIDSFHDRPKGPWSAAPDSEIGEMRLNQLRALGYVLER